MRPGPRDSRGVRYPLGLPLELQLRGLQTTRTVCAGVGVCTALKLSGFIGSGLYVFVLFCFNVCV